jgi:hypothetical protein
MVDIQTMDILVDTEEHRAAAAVPVLAVVVGQPQ